jgi:hypothetical protein
MSIRKRHELSHLPTTCREEAEKACFSARKVHKIAHIHHPPLPPSLPHLPR